MRRCLDPCTSGSPPAPAASATRSSGGLVSTPIFGALLVTVSVIADYARVHAVVAGVRSAPAAIAASLRFVRRHAATVFTLYLMTGTLFVALLIVYGATETIGRSRVGGWRAVAVGQAYILARLAIRLIFGASEVRLFQALRPQTPADSAGVSEPR